jgi:cell division GTPase FtsZ
MNKIRTRTLDQIKSILKNEIEGENSIPINDIMDLLDNVEMELEERDERIEELEKENQLTDDQREALELVDELKTCSERFNFGVESEAERIKEIHQLLTECGELNV